MQFFRCREIEGTSYLMADYSIKCTDGLWWALLPFNLVLLLGFVLGTPLAIFLVLYPRRHTLYDPETRKPKPHPLDVLYRPYRPGAWYFEAVSMSYKIALW